MRILYVYQYFSTEQGSWGTRAYEFARRWVEEGDEVTVVTSVYDKSDLTTNGFLTRSEIDGIDLRIINVPISNKHGLWTRALTFGIFTLVASLYALFSRYDVVLASSGPLTVGIPALLARWIRRQPLVFEVRDLFSEGIRQLGLVRSNLLLALSAWFEKLVARQADAVVCLSPGMAAWFESATPSIRTQVIPNAADNDLFGIEPDSSTAGALRPKGEVWFLYAGTLGRANRCDVLVSAAAKLQLRQSSARIILIGDGSERKRLEARAEAEGLTHVRFVDLQPRSDLPQWFNQATATLLVFQPVPVLDTTSPNKLFDALAAGLPVIQTTQGWIKDLLENENCGLTVHSTDSEELAIEIAEAIERLATEPRLRAEMAENARRLARGTFDRTVLSARMHAVLRKAAGSRRPQSSNPAT